VGERNNSAVALLPVLVPTETFKPGPTMYHASNKAYYRLLFLHCGRPKQDYHIRILLAFDRGLCPRFSIGDKKNVAIDTSIKLDVSPPAKLVGEKGFLLPTQLR
jgi:hypothetical protein